MASNSLHIRHATHFNRMRECVIKDWGSKSRYVCWAQTCAKEDNDQRKECSTNVALSRARSINSFFHFGSNNKTFYVKRYQLGI